MRPTSRSATTRASDSATPYPPCVPSTRVHKAVIERHTGSKGRRRRLAQAREGPRVPQVEPDRRRRRHGQHLTFDARAPRSDFEMMPPRAPRCVFIASRNQRPPTRSRRWPCEVIPVSVRGRVRLGYGIVHDRGLRQRAAGSLNHGRDRDPDARLQNRMTHFDSRPVLARRGAPLGVV